MTVVDWCCWHNHYYNGYCRVRVATAKELHSLSPTHKDYKEFLADKAVAARLKQLDLQNEAVKELMVR